jgi:hypothetical protein
VWLFYLLLQRILDAKTTILRYYDGIVVGFTVKGVELFPPHRPETLKRVQEYPEGTWALIDEQFRISGDTYVAPEGLFSSPNLYTIFTASQPNRYKSWMKQSCATRLIMNPFSMREYLFAA